MKNRIGKVVLAGLLAASLLTACGSKAEEAPAASAVSEASSAASTAAALEEEAEEVAEEMAASAEQAAEEATQAAEEALEEAGEDTSGTAGEAAVQITDMTGREITLEEPATRIVALSAADCEVLYAVGAGDLLVGRGEYCDYPAEVLEIPSVQSGMETNIEQIVALEPQVLLMSTMAQTEEQVQALEEAGIRVVVSDAQDIEGVYESLAMIGALTGKETEAAAVIDNMKATFAEVEAAAAEGGTVYFEVSPLEYGLWAGGKGTFMDEIAAMAGLTNAFADVEGWGEISEEQVIERDPDYIVTISMYFGEGPTPEEEIASRPGWENIKAVKNGAILNLQNNELSRPAPRLAEGAKMLSAFVAEHPITESMEEAA